MKKVFFLFAALALLVAPQVKADTFTNALNFTITDSGGNVLAFTLSPSNLTGITSNFPGGPSPGNPTGAILPGDIDVFSFGFPPITFNGTPDGSANFAFSISAYDGSGHLTIGALNLPWNGVAWNAASTPVSGPEFLDGFVPGSYAVTIGNGSGVFTITNAPEPGMFASLILGLICLGGLEVNERRKSLS